MKRNGTTEPIGEPKRERIGQWAALLVAALLALAVPAVPPIAAAAERPAGPPAFGGTARPFIFLKEPQAVQLGPFADAEGRPAAMARYRGRVLLVNFWATWCAPCIHEMPTLDRLQAALGGPDFAVLTVALDRTGSETVLPFWAAQGYRHLPLLLDRRWETARRFGVGGLPATFLLDRTGRIVGYLLGPAVWDSPPALAFLRYHIAASGR